MRLGEGPDELEILAEASDELRAVVSLDRQATTPLRPLERERRHDNVATDPKRTPNGVQVASLIGVVRQEMKHGPVVPHVHGMREAEAAGIRDEPSHAGGTITETGAGYVQGSLGNIHHDDAGIAGFQKPVHERRRASANVYDLDVQVRRNCADQLDSGSRVRLKPTDLVGPLGRPYLLPVGLGVFHAQPTITTITAVTGTTAPS